MDDITILHHRGQASNAPDTPASSHDSAFIARAVGSITCVARVV